MLPNGITCWSALRVRYALLADIGPSVVRQLSVKVKVKERIVLREIHLRTTGRHLSMGSHSV